MSNPTFARDHLRSFVERVESLESEIKELSSDKSDIYKEAKAMGFDVKALKSVIAIRRKDPNEIEEHNAIVDLYLSTLSGKSEAGTRVATRAGARDEDIGLAAPTNLSSEDDAPDIPDFLDRRSELNRSAA